MHRFWGVLIRPMIEARGFTRAVEIGSQAGGNTKQLLQLCVELGAHADIVDPFPPHNMPELQGLLATNGRFHQGLSLDVLPELPAADVYLLDGDHNYYTVFNELRLIQDKVEAEATRWPVIFFHDVLWPYARRDLYYDPENVPEHGRHPWTLGGVLPGEAGVFTDRGLNRHLKHAEEGGEKNGVLTAIEDFMATRPGAYEWRAVPVLHGLGVLFPSEEAQSEWVAPLRELLDVPERVRQLYQLVEGDRLKHALLAEGLRYSGDAARSALSTARSELSAVRSELSAVRSELSAARSEVSTTRSDLSTAHSELARLRSQLQAQEEVLDSRAHRLAEASRDARRKFRSLLS